MLINASRSRDILECIASLSSDEVATPPAVANQVLDLLPVEVWSNKDLKWLDPACKTGVFLREAARRLMEGLADSIPNETERRMHIFTKMLHGYALTELTAQMSRRSLYYNKDASNKKLSVVPFKSKEGNIQFTRQDHEYNKNGKCLVCGAGQADFGALGNRERHAYDFIHKLEEDMKFDVIVGNPPYQLESGGFGVQATPIYNLFVEQAFRLQPRYVAMIIPSRWFSGGMGLDGFRERMLASRNFRNLVDYPDATLLFPGIDLSGGACYFLWDSTYNGQCEVVGVSPAGRSAPMMRYLNDQGDALIRFNEAITIIQKVKNRTNSSSLAPLVSAINPFQLATNFTDYKDAIFSGAIAIRTKSGIGYLEKINVHAGKELIGKWKVLLSAAYGERGAFPYLVIGKPIILAPESCCTMTYIVAGAFNTEAEAASFSSFLRTKLARFLVLMRKSTQHISKKSFTDVPVMNWNVQWTDQALYKFFGIEPSEVEYIESLVRPMDA